MRKLATTLIVCSVVLGLLQMSTSNASAEGGSATWTAGDFWEYTGSGTLMGNTFTMLMKVEAKDKVTVTVGSISYESWHCAATISMTISGATVTYSADLYIRVSDLADVKMTMSIAGTTMTMTYDPPNKDLDFPLSSGKTWSNTMVETTTTTPGGTSSRTVSVSYETSGPESVTVPAGTFNAYKIRRTEQGIQGNVSTAYYTDAVGYMLKLASPLAGISAGLELKSYNYQAKTFLGGMLGILILVIVVVAVVAVVAAILVRRRRAQMMAPQPPQYQPTYGQPAQQQTPYQPPIRPPTPPQQP